jgi:glutamine synthetase
MFINKIILDYVWIGGNNELRSKIRVFKLDKNIETMDKKILLSQLEWNYDGSSTQQADGDDSEITLKAVNMYPEPIYAEKRYFIICDTYKSNGEPAKNNNRKLALELFNTKLEEKPWFGMEQEYFMMKNLQHPEPIGYKNSQKQGQYYCGVGAENAFGREIAEKHLKVCILYGINISGINAEVAPGQWEFQIGPCEGINAGDEMILARYLLIKIAEKENISIDFEPKPLKGDWNGSGCHTNYSTKNMREGYGNTTGLDYINNAIEKLADKHNEHMQVYGTGNEQRMTGKHETASYDIFTFGVGNRGASVRIGNKTFTDKKGYFEDRRPSSNCDPYLVTSKIFETTCLN